MSRAIVVSGQVFGVVDWVTASNDEIGMFLPSTKGQTRVILTGNAVRQQISNGIVRKGMTVTALGSLGARCVQQQAGPVPEVVCHAVHLVAEPPHAARTKGIAYALVKGVAMVWDPEKLVIKVFVPQPGGQMVCSMTMHKWVDGLPTDSKPSFMAAMRLGREFTAAALLETDSYEGKEGQVPVLKLLPTDFRLQG